MGLASSHGGANLAEETSGIHGEGGLRYHSRPVMELFDVVASQLPIAETGVV